MKKNNKIKTYMLYDCADRLIEAGKVKNIREFKQVIAETDYFHVISYAIYNSNYYFISDLECGIFHGYTKKQVQNLFGKHAFKF